MYDQVFSQISESGQLDKSVPLLTRPNQSTINAYYNQVLSSKPVLDQYAILRDLLLASEE